MFWNLYHITDVYDGSRITQKMTFLGMVESTKEEIDQFLKEWNKPRVYYYPYDKLFEHTIVATQVKKVDLKEISPYNPKTKDWPDIPFGMDLDAEWNPETKTWKNPF